MSQAFTSPAEAASAVKHALHAAIGVALAGQTDPDGEAVDISFGIRWPPVAHEAVAVTAVEWATIQSEEQSQTPRRTRYDDVSVTVNLFAERPGADQAKEIEASDRAFELLHLISEHLREGTNTTLGGVAMWCFQTTARSEGATDEDDQGEGWHVIEIAATFVARVLIRQP